MKATDEEIKQLDKWYTKDEVVETIMSQLPVDINDFDNVIDLCAGDGSWRKYCNKMYDIHPEAEDIVKQDIFDWKGEEGTTLVIGNFAYGRAASMTIKMLNHVARYCDHIVNIGPMTMTRYSRQRRVDKDLKLLWEIRLPKNSFLVDGKSRDVPSICQYWGRNGSCLRVDKPVEHKIDDWEYNTDDWNCFVNVNSRKIYEPDHSCFSNSSLRIKSHIPIDELRTKFDEVSWVGASSVSGGVYCLTRADINNQYANHHSCLRVDKPNSNDWEFNRKEPTHFIIGASRRIKPMSDYSKDWRGYKISSKLPTKELQKRFDSVKWKGVSSVSGGLFWSTQAEIRRQYDKVYLV